jgi:ribosomal protein L5
MSLHISNYYNSVLLPHLFEKFNTHSSSSFFSVDPICDSININYNKKLQSKNFIQTFKSDEPIEGSSDLGSDIRTVLNCMFFEQVLKQRHKYTRARRSIASFYIKKKMRLGYYCTLREVSLFDFILEFGLYSSTHDVLFKGFRLKPSEKANNFLKGGFKDFSRFSIIDYEFYDWSTFYLYGSNGLHFVFNTSVLNIYILIFFLSSFEVALID